MDDLTAPSPLVGRVAMKVIDLIRSEGLAAGNGLPSERKLAFDLAVSRGVVRAAIKSLVAQGYIDAKRNCRPVVKLRRLAATGKKHIAIWLWPNSADFAAASILKGIQSTEFAGNVRLIVSNAPSGSINSIYEAERRFLRSVLEEPDEAGVILWYLGGQQNLDVLRLLRASDVPMVFLDRLPPDGFDADFVGTNNESAAHAGVTHLVGLGHRRIGLITNLDAVSSVFERESGYRSALQDAGIAFDDTLVQRDFVDDPAGVEAALDALFALNQPPTAIFCINDHLALQTLDALTRRGIAVPDELSLLGFDGLLRWVPGGGRLSTLTQDFERMGRIGAQILSKRMDAGPVGAYRHVLLDAPLARHGSTAAAPAGVGANRRLE